MSCNQNNNVYEANLLIFMLLLPPCRCIQMLTEHFGSIAAATVRNLDIEKFPLLALVYKLRGTMEIFQVRK